MQRSLSLSVNSKHSQESAFFAVTEFFVDSFRKFNKIINHSPMTSSFGSSFSTSDASPFVKNNGNKGLSTNILKHTLNVILGFIPRIHIKHYSLDTRVEPEYDGKGVDISRPENDHQWNFTKGLDVVCQCATLLKRLKTHIKINSLFCHPRAWLLARPEDLDSRVKPENDKDVVKSIFPKKNEYNNIWPQWAPDATEFLSDVYKSGTRTRKTRALETAESGVDKVVSSCEKKPNVHKTYMNFLRQRKTALDAPLHAVSSGRSMIEMLGVLAIIGVLSVGGIAGYSKAMEKFKINKTIQQISEIAANVRTLYAQQKDFEGLNNETAIQMGVIPDDLETNVGYSGSIKHAWGEIIEIGLPWRDANPNYFQIMFQWMTKEACMALATTDWGNISSTGVVGIGINNVTAIVYQIDLDNCVTKENPGYYGYFACSQSLPISPAIAAQYCGKYGSVYDDHNSFIITFKK